jgi:hypothetical protein
MLRLKTSGRTIKSLSFSDKMRKMVSFEVILHCVIHLAIKEKTNTKKGDPNAGYHL